ncbi:glycoside hydrolase [Bacillus arachidis]|uniref:Glycoside hydrolase n=1 Tax=Bacillus arachidis TaxID=2819290 RepID=A0ABS3P059_9BACI|nr:glycoside hydrolase [Bacillus arachidis]MBO1626176.1 glycoside hydrolase [Bacillus arachidis]
MKKAICYVIISVLLLITFPSVYYAKGEKKKINEGHKFQYSDFSFDVTPETGEIVVEKDGVKESASLPVPKKKVADVKKTDRLVSWSYPDDKMEIKVEKKKYYLDITLKSDGAKQFEWPKVSANSYTLPLWEGKRIPADDPYWKEFLKDEEFSFIENFSMRFFALDKSKYSIVYIADNMFNDSIHFNTDGNIQFSFTHKFPSINPNKEYGFRLYVTDSDPSQIAQVYKNYIKEKGEFKTLTEKAKENPNIKKLYGAPHIYLWNENAITVENIRWNQLKSKLDEPFIAWMEQLLKQTEDGSTEFEAAISELNKQEYIDKYQKNIIIRSFNKVLKLDQFYNNAIFQNTDNESKKLLEKGISHLSEQELYTLNKLLLKSKLKDAADDIEQWGKQDSTNLIEDMHQSGIKHAWIGLPNWSNGLMNPGMVKEVNDLGYLIGPYDSYHSIQENASKDWNTASFEDKSLYEKATITNKSGEKIKGFLGKGRKLNPTLSLPSVKQRTDSILQNGIPFNSWFVDCDATGEIYDDYSPDHITTQAQDLKARLQRMDYIGKEKHMVVGSEGGNDFASNVIAFAHGIETPVIKWDDEDMRQNKTSPYYVGDYWSSNGATPERYSKTVPIKPLYQHIYLDSVYSLPLYKLVYNDSVITTHHWEWGSLKIKDEVGNRMLSELLYNVPPLYHIDKDTWNTNKDMIVSYVNIWSDFHQKAVTKPMTNFKILSEDRLVQCTEFGEDMKVIVNFSNKSFKYKGEEIKGKTAVIYDGHSKKVWDASKY